MFARRTDRAPDVEDRGDYEVRRVWARDSARSAWALVSELRTGGYDAVQFNLHMTYFGTTNAHRFLGLALPPLCRALLDVPVVTTLHDLLEIVEEDHVDDTVGTLERLGARAATSSCSCRTRRPSPPPSTATSSPSATPSATPSTSRTARSCAPTAAGRRWRRRCVCSCSASSVRRRTSRRRCGGSPRSGRRCRTPNS
ncbi:hypothetical protein ACFQRB_05375 [Halobaculum litoreum]|uniref:Glycosyltransferase subfamily 4-like N-terminal domain-containing protein n=1 Tax=Halobaculum litoreum TaxID=3031998 RepID=A0ABD5XMB3_9EURY